MTVRVSTLKGPLAGAYYTEEVGGYYLDAGEPAGQWWGRGAEVEFGLSGELATEEFLLLMSGCDPLTSQQLGRAYGERSARGYDVTFSAPKSVSVLWAVGDWLLQDQITDAHDAAVEAVLGFVERHAHVRPSVRGQVVVVDGRGLTVGRFRQHTSRSLDPQLHTHAVIVAKVRAPNGGWYALDARLIKHDQRALSALYHASLRAELTRRLGVEWRDPVNGIAEIAGVADEILERFSRRTADVEARLQVRLDRFRKNLEREPTVRERWRLEREAVTDSRPTKPKGVSAVELHRTWRHELIRTGIEPETLIDTATGRAPGRTITGSDQERMALLALRDLTARQSSWRPTELVGAIARATPTTSALPAADVVGLAEDLAGQLIDKRLVDLGPDPDQRLPVRSDGRPITESVLDRRVTLPAILDQETRFVAWAERCWAKAGLSARLSGAGIAGLDRAQLAVAAAASGTAPLVCVVGPAGAGKTTALRPAVRALQVQQRPVFGVAPSATAAAVLARQTGMPTDTVDKLLYEHNRTDRPPAEPYRLPAGTTIVVDEASMVGTLHLGALADLAERRRWRVVLVGDPDQLAAVGRSGMFAHLCSAGPTIELDRIHRFDEAWERAASLRLRAGDQGVLEVYDLHGRVEEGTRLDMERLATGRWWTAHQRGERVLLVTPTNETARRLNDGIQRTRHEAWQLGSRYLRTSAGLQLFVGDQIVTRHNDRQLRTDRGTMVRNRAEWTVTAIDQQALTLTVRGPDGTVTLPAEYIDSYVELGYAQTIHAAQGRTVDRCILVAGEALDGRGLYVAMTRGRLSNDALVVTDGNRSALDVLGNALAREWDDTPAIETRAELSELRRDADRLARIPSLDDGARTHDRLTRELGLDRARHSSRGVEDDFGLEL